VWSSGDSGRSGGPVPPVWWFSARGDYQDQVIEVMRSASSLLHHHGPTVTRDLSFLLCGDNLDLIRAKAENFEVIRS